MKIDFFQQLGEETAVIGQKVASLTAELPVMEASHEVTEFAKKYIEDSSLLEKFPGFIWENLGTPIAVLKLDYYTGLVEGIKGVPSVLNAANDVIEVCTKGLQQADQITDQSSALMEGVTVILDMHAGLLQEAKQALEENVILKEVNEKLISNINTILENNHALTSKATEAFQEAGEGLKSMTSWMEIGVAAMAIGVIWSAYQTFTSNNAKKQQSEPSTTKKWVAYLPTALSALGLGCMIYAGLKTHQISQGFLDMAPKFQAITLQVV